MRKKGLDTQESKVCMEEVALARGEVNSAFNADDSKIDVLHRIDVRKED